MTDPIRRNFLAADYQSLLDALQRQLNPPPQRNALADTLRGLGSSNQAMPKAGIGNIFGSSASLPPPLHQNLIASALAAKVQPSAQQVAPIASPVRRRLFFSFHYDDVRRTCIVRKSWKFRPGWSDPRHNFTDKSLWEKSRSESDEALRRLIRRGMDGTSVTCILAGAQTWSRPYVRYEIAHSLMRRSGLFTVHIHNTNDPHEGYGTVGRDPLGCVGLQLREDGRGRVCELVGETWYYFDAMKMPVPWPRWLPRPAVGRVQPLTAGSRSYDWHFDDGHSNLPGWAHIAAIEAGKA